MDHIAILNKKFNFLPKVLSGEKSIESRWYVSKVAPWDRIFTGDVVYFKNSGESVTAVAEVAKVLQIENLTEQKISEVLRKYGREIGFTGEQHEWWAKANSHKKYCILIFLKNPKKIKQFAINKKGFGASTAWMVVGDIEGVRL